MARRKAPKIPDQLLDQLLAGRDPGSALSEGGVLDDLERAFAERALNAEMDHHLAEEAADGGGNRRNGYGRKTLLTETGKLPIAVPRDRLATFDPQLIAHEMGPSTGVACRASTTVRRIGKRSGEAFPRQPSRCMRVGSPSASSRAIWPSSTASTSRPSW